MGRKTGRKASMFETNKFHRTNRLEIFGDFPVKAIRPMLRPRKHILFRFFYESL